MSCCSTSASPPSTSSSAVSSSSSLQNRCPFSINALLHPSQNTVPKCSTPPGTTAAFSDALQQCLPMFFAARGLMNEGTATTVRTPFSKPFRPFLLGDVCMDEEQKRMAEKDNGGEDEAQVPTSEESSQSEDDGTVVKEEETNEKMKEEEEEQEEEKEEFEKIELKVKEEQQQQTKKEGAEEGDKASKEGTMPEGCFVPWLFPVLPPSAHNQPPSLLHPAHIAAARGPPPVFPPPFMPAFLKSPLGLPAQFLLSAGTFSTSCGPCTPQSAAQMHQQQHIQHNQHKHQHKRKGGQIRFSNEQTDILETTFVLKKYLNNNERKRLAKTLDLNERQVKTWFQNRRAKWRRQMPPETEGSREGEENNSEMGGGGGGGGTAPLNAASAEHLHHHHHHPYELYMQRQ